MNEMHLPTNCCNSNTDKRDLLRHKSLSVANFSLFVSVMRKQRSTESTMKPRKTGDFDGTKTDFSIFMQYPSLMALSDYNVLANVCQRMKN